MIDEALKIWLEDVEERAESLSIDFGNGVGPLAKFYSLLGQLIYKQPLQTIDFLENTAIWRKALPEPLQQIIEIAQEGFRLQIEPEMRVSLKTLMSKCENQLFPPRETQLLKEAATHWLHYIDALPIRNLKPASLEVRLLPSLDLDTPEERSLPGLRKIQIPFAVTNWGELPALNVVLRVDLRKLPGVVPGSEPNFTPTPGNKLLLETKSFFSIGAKQTRIVPLNLRYPANGDISASVEHKNFLSDSASEPNIGLPDFVLPDPKRCEEDLKNPYNHRLPLTTEWQWEDIMKGNHRDIVKGIRDYSNSELGFICAIQGLKHTGKTSVMMELYWHLQKNKKLLPVYVDFYSWWDSLYEKQQTIDGEELWYHIADSVARKIEGGESALLDIARKKGTRESAFKDAKRGEPEKEPGSYTKDSYNHEDQPMRMSHLDFEDFAQKISAISGKRLVLLLDELDSVIGSKEFRDDAQAIFSPLRNLATKHSYMVVIAHVRVSQELQKKNVSVDSAFLSRNPFVIKFLEFSDLFFVKKESPDEKSKKALAQLTSLVYTPTAQQCIFNLTGGWPAIVQLVFYRIVEKVRRERFGDRVLVDVGFVKNVIKEILVSPDAQEMISYLLESFDVNEIDLLRGLVYAGAVNYETAQIDGVKGLSEGEFLVRKKIQICASLQSHKFDQAFTRLVEKQIIEAIGANGNTYRLRVGLLAYSTVLKSYNT